MIARRRFVAGAVGLVFVPGASHGAVTEKVARVGCVVASETLSRYVEALRQGLRELGWIEGRNLVLEIRSAESRPARLPGLLKDLIALKPDVIVTGGGTAGARAAMQATKTIPLVTPAVADPIGAGLVTNLAHPGGNFTGLSMQNTEISAKRLELLKAVVPGIVRVGVLRDPGSEPAQVTEVERAAGPLGVRLDVLDARGADDFDAAFAEARKRRVDAMLVLASSFFNTERRRLVELAAVHRLPAIYEQRDFAKAGGLVSYGPDIAEMYRRASTYVDKILKGAKPGDLPIEQPTKFELVVNVKTAKALKLAIPQAVLLRADEVIE